MAVANNDIKIRLTGSLNTGKSIGEINTQVKALAKKINSLNLNIKLNDNVSKTLTDFSSQLNKVKQESIQTAKHIEEVINPDGSKIKRTWTGDLANEFRETTTEAKKTKKEIQETVSELDKYQRKVNNFQKSMRLDADNLGRTHGNFINPKSMQEFDAQLSKLNPKSKTLNQDMADLRTQFKGVSVEAKSTAGALNQAGMSFGEMMKTAMTKFPVWMLSATLFYAPIRAVQDMTGRLVELDTQIVSLNRVMDVDNFELINIMKTAIDTADELGSKLTDVLSITNDFARMGFEGSALTEISKTGQVLQNISDLDATGAVNTLTSAMLNFNIAGEDSIMIADKLNEVDNNYAISTLDLSDSIRKAASTAKTFGVELDQLIGYTAAIGSTTRESGSIIGNGLKTIFSRMTTMQPAIGAMNDLGISIHDIEGNVKPVSQLLEELAGRWGGLTDEQRQNTSVSIAGRYQLSR